MPLDHKLHARVHEALQQDPLAAEELVRLVSGGLAAWRERVESQIDTNANWGMSAALALPAYRPGRAWLRVEDASHRTHARMVAVGWNLHRRYAASPIERELVVFVRAADAHDAKRARAHYATIINEREIPAYHIFGEEEQ